jgi:uroporphyrinogen-III synthase
MGNLSENKPLSGINILVTRAREQAGELTMELESMGARVHAVPAVLMKPEADQAGIRELLDDPGSCDNLVFTSVNGVEFFLKFLENDPVGAGTGSVPAPADLSPALCVGSKTALAWEKAGGKVGLVPENYTAHGLLDMLEEDLSGQRFVVLRPREVTTALGELIQARGGEVKELILYRTMVPEEGAAELQKAMKAGLDVVTFTSPSAVRGIITLESRIQNSESSRLLDIPAICIGPTTANAAEEEGFTEVYFPDEHTAEGMIAELMVIAGALKRTQNTERSTQKE